MARGSVRTALGPTASRRAASNQSPTRRWWHANRRVAAVIRRRPTAANAAAAGTAPGTGAEQADLFSVDPSGQVMHALDGAAWPPNSRFPFNRAGSHVRTPVWEDLLGSPRPLVVAGYAAIAELVDFVSEWDSATGAGVGGGDEGASAARLLFGAEPYPSANYSFTSANLAFTQEARAYWEDRGVSLRLSAKVLAAIAALDAGRVRARFIHGATTLHAKVYVGSRAATVGSSNFTRAGLVSQLEANARFEAATEPARYRELVTIGENLWAQGQPWDDELRALLEDLLRLTSWEEALVRACADLLEGEWAARYLGLAGGVGATLWPAQRAGIAQALWIVETVGSALVADATGSGKTRMGAHLVRAVRDRMWSTGRARRDLAVVVCPPAVERTWRHEAAISGVNLQTVSHGLLSREGTYGRRVEEDVVAQAQILAVDESHNFLNPDARRTRQVRESRADHVLLFTATPINRGAADLLQLVGFLGADNFDDDTIEVLRRLDRRRASDQQLTAGEVDRLRREIQRFTVRRTKALLNALVERDPDAYIHPESGRICRYPAHDARTYATGETPADEAVAERIRDLTAQLVGVAQLERVVSVPAPLRAEYSDDRWLAFRVASVRGLAAYHVLSAMRSSRAALVEHLAGTAAASERFRLPRFKAVATGDVTGKLERLAAEGPPEIRLECELPPWLADPASWQAACEAELDRYRGILAAATDLSEAREEAKGRLLADLAARHDRVLAFDHHPITLELLRRTLRAPRSEVLVATGATPAERRRVEDAFERTSSRRAVALCSDAMNEGLNLQGASAVVHLDLPTTLRVAEQRIGRVDRMDSPHDTIEAWWPQDGRAFATRANELLAQRAAESEQLLGSNLQVPPLMAGAADQVVDVQERISEAEAPGAETWDGIRDALEPVRSLVSGDHPLVDPTLYDDLRSGSKARVVSAVAASSPWAFLAVSATAHGAPRWLLLEGPALTPVVHLDAVAEGLRARLAADPPGVSLEDSLPALERALDVATRVEHLLLPRRLQRALDQLRRLTRVYAAAGRRAGDERSATRWMAIGALADHDRADHSRTASRPDPYSVAERWLDVVRPRLDAERSRRRNQLLLLRDLDRALEAEPLSLGAVEAAFGGLASMAPLDERVTACILGVPVP